MASQIFWLLVSANVQITFLFCKKKLLFYIIEQNKFFSKVLNEYGLKYRRLLRQEPTLLFLDHNSIENCKKILMSFFSLSEQESQRVLTINPSILVMNENELVEKYKNN